MGETTVIDYADIDMGQNAPYTDFGSIWSKKWLENYEGKSPEGKELQQFLKKNYGGQSYIPWATMVRMLFMQDPSAILDVVKTRDGKVLHTDVHQVTTENGEHKTVAQGCVHYVIVKCRFLQFEVEEIYPVQTPQQKQMYAAPKIVDQNMVNKAIQRAKAKAISTATGLAFQLYENGDLQFEEDEAEPNKATIVKNPVKSEEKSTAAKKESSAKVKKTPPSKPVEDNPVEDNPVEDEDVDGAVEALAQYIHKNDDVLEPLKRLNITLVKKYNFMLSPEQSLDELREHISVLPNPAVTHRVLKNMVKDLSGKDD
jgi:hypothetical protein